MMIADFRETGPKPSPRIALAVLMLPKLHEPRRKTPRKWPPEVGRSSFIP
jgi:hypothetical protein